MNQIPSIVADGVPVRSPPSSSTTAHGLSLNTSSAFPTYPVKSPIGMGIALSPSCKSHPTTLPDNVLTVDATNVDDLSVYTSGSSDVLVIDVRPFNLYSASRLKTARNICIPSTLLKRSSYDMAHVINSSALPPETKNRLLKFIPTKILVYDASSTKGQLSTSLLQTLNKFLKYDCFSVAFLNGGLQLVDSRFVDTKATTPMRSPISPQTPNSAVMSNSELMQNGTELLLLPSDATFLSGFSLPSATASNQKMLMSIKKNLPRLDTSTNYNHELRLPSKFAEKMHKLPKWLMFLADGYGSEDYNKSIINKLSEKFNKLEKSEQLRLSMAINNYDKQSLSTMQKSPSHVHDSPEGHCTPLTLCPYCDEITYTIPKGIEYGDKNRYNNIWPYEHSRVCLVSSPCSTKKENADDYFNANYIHYEKLSRTKYIATQNPLEATNEDFWNTVWYNGVKGIVCLNNPLLISPRTYYDSDLYFSKGDLAVEIRHKQKYDGFTFREIEMTKHQTTKKTVYHFAYSDWPDFGTPDNFHTVFNMMQIKNDKVKSLSEQKPPSLKIPQAWDLLVHCSAGCGRTGCYITLDMVIDCFENHLDGALDPWGDIDLVYKSIQFQRQQRISMVQNLEQFIYCYESILNYVVEKLV